MVQEMFAYAMAALSLVGLVVMVYHEYLMFTRLYVPKGTKFDFVLLLGGLGGAFLWIAYSAYLAGTHQQELLSGNLRHEVSGGQFLTLVSFWFASWISIVWACLRNIWRYRSVDGNSGTPTAKPALPFPRAVITSSAVLWQPTPPAS